MPIAKYLLDVIKNDASQVVRQHVARAISESILMSLAIGEVFTQPPGIMDGDDLEQGEKQNVAIVKALRKEFSARVELKQLLQDALMYVRGLPEADTSDSYTRPDHSIRFALIKIAEMITSSQAEPLPGNLITLQTPVVETPALTPRIRISVGDAKEYFPSLAVQAPAPASPVAPLKLTVNTNKRVHKSQSKGLSDSDLAAISLVLKKIVSLGVMLTDTQRADKRSTPFRQPVDPVRDHAPEYVRLC
jgi:transcription initiation factor TFIID subunit 2